MLCVHAVLLVYYFHSNHLLCYIQEAQIMSQIKTATAWGEARMLPAMPIEVSYRVRRSSISMESDGGAAVFRFRFKGEELPVIPEVESASTVHGEFFKVKEPMDALHFLEWTGDFIDSAEDRMTDRLTWADFQTWQKILTRVFSQGFFMMVRSFDEDGVESLWTPEPLDPKFERLILAASESTYDWLRGYASGIQLDQKHPNVEHRKIHEQDRVDRSADPTFSSGDKPELMLSLTVATAVEAMLATYYIDEKNGVNYELCKGEKCQNVFVVKTNHGKVFCSQKCAHLFSVQRSREEAKKAKAAAAAKAAARQSTHKVGRKNNG
jgi:hypothetical protein